MHEMHVLYIKLYTAYNATSFLISPALGLCDTSTSVNLGTVS